MQMLTPSEPAEVAALLAAAAGRGETIRITGSGSKRAMGGPEAPASVDISTLRLNRVLEYEPRDLTISVEAGMKFADLTALLARNRQMVPLDPPYFADATVGGVVACDTSGPRRRLYGGVRDQVIGMRFATIEGHCIDTGGKVVKNVAGLDMGKLMIGSFGTLAAIAVVNFKLHPMPEETRTLVIQTGSADEAIAARNRILRSVLTPSAIDLLNPEAARTTGFDGWTLLLQAGGIPPVLDRYRRELPEAAVLTDTAERDLWARVAEFTPRQLSADPQCQVGRITRPIQDLAEWSRFPGPALARAGNGITYLYGRTLPDGATIDFAPPEQKAKLQLWPEPGSGFAMMEKIKTMMDPQRLLNPGRLYGRI